jgi:hypothetical protein
MLTQDSPTHLCLVQPMPTSCLAVRAARVAPAMPPLEVRSLCLSPGPPAQLGPLPLSHPHPRSPPPRPARLAYRHGGFYLIMGFTRSW